LLLLVRLGMLALFLLLLLLLPVSGDCAAARPSEITNLLGTLRLVVVLRVARHVPSNNVAFLLSCDKKIPRWKKSRLPSPAANNIPVTH